MNYLFYVLCRINEGAEAHSSPSGRECTEPLEGTRSWFFETWNFRDLKISCGRGLGKYVITVFLECPDLGSWHGCDLSCVNAVGMSSRRLPAPRGRVTQAVMQEGV